MDESSWLPKLIRMADYNGDSIYYVDTLYKFFLDELVNGELKLFNKPVIVPSELDKDGRHERFWHTITDPHNPSVSDIKHTRSERILWIKATITNVYKDEVLVYERRKGKDNRLHLFIPKHKYIVILTERKKAYYFTTAFFIEYTYKVKDYQREYERFGPKTKTAP